MIEPNELRIGNWVSRVNGESYEATVSTISDLENGHLIVNSIPITKQWLLRFGFIEKLDERMVNGYEYLLQVTGSNEHLSEFEVNRDETWFAAIGTYTWKKDGSLAVSVLCRGNYVCRSPMYVHELQNLYFMLTGQELNVLK